MAGATIITTTGLLLLVFYTHWILPTDAVTIPSFCCMSFVSKKFPEKQVVSYQLANGSVCPKAGVIFTTKKGQKFCGDPKQPWVQRHIRNLDAKRDPASKGARARGARFPIQRHHGNTTSLIQRRHANSASL